MGTQRQAGLFDDAGEAAAPGAALLKVAGPAATLTKAQKEFNRVSARVAQLRDHLAAWQAASEAMDRRRIAKQLPLERELLALQRDTVLWIDAFLQRPPAGETLGQRARGKLVSMLLVLARAVLDAGPDAEVEAAHDRHSQVDHRDHQADETDLAAAMLGHALGDDSLFEGEAGSVDELLQRAAQRLQQRQQAEVAGTDDAGPQARRAARDAKALKEASQSVREVYRRLASTLHPDREPDAALREHKSALMARANQAYEARDLLTLLSLQLETEQIDAGTLAALGDSRLRHYVRVLKEQQESLEAELAALQMPVAVAMDAAPGLLNWAPALLETSFRHDMQNLRDALEGLGHDARRLRDARTRAAFLRQLRIDDPEQGLSEMEAAMIEQMLAEMAPPPPGSGRRRRR